MCGIAGVYFKDPQARADQSVVRLMCESIRHRGPDGEGYYVDKQLAMGMRRLAVIDLEGGEQPIANEDGSVVVVFNGEIYNYTELRKQLESDGHSFRTRSDTEVLVHGYEKWTSDLPGFLNGMFAFSLWDQRNQRLVLARDHIGVKPLYLYEDDEKIAWASEIKALLEIPGIERELDELALFDFLRFGYVPAPRTMFRRIRKIDPATVVVVQNGRLRERKYWELSFDTNGHGHRSAESWSEELRELLDDTVRRQLMSDVPLGAFLSGGLDSSSIVATMSRLGVDHIATYAIGFGQEDAFHNELDKASEVARRFNTDHHEIIVEPDVTELISPLIHHLDEPFTDTSFLVSYLVSKLARETVTVILSGVGGDEIFAGYRRYLGPRLQKLYRLVPSAIRSRLVKPLFNNLPVDRGSPLKSLLRYTRGFVNQADRPAPQMYQGYVSVFENGERHDILAPELAELEARHSWEPVAKYYDAAPSTDPLNSMLYADLKTSLVDSLLTFTDKMSMAVSLEARVPLLDYRLVELAARIPPSLKLRGLHGMKHIFKQAMRDRLPESILNRKKQGFGTPISRWFRTSLKPMLNDLLSPERIQRRGYFQPQSVRKLVDDHTNQRADYSEHILALLTFEVWHQAYLG